MDKASLVEGIHLLGPSEMRAARVTPKDGITEFYAIDMQHVAAVIVNFKEEMAEDEAYIDLQKFSTVVKKIGSLDVSVNIGKDKTKVVGGFQEFEISNIGIANAPKKIPIKNVFPAHTCMPREDLYLFLKAANQISGSFNATIDEYEIKFTATNKDEDEVTLELPIDMLYEHKADGKYASMYPIDWVLKFASRTKAEKIWFYSGNDIPVKLHVDGETYDATMLVAPQIEPND